MRHAYRAWGIMNGIDMSIGSSTNEHTWRVGQKDDTPNKYTAYKGRTKSVKRCCSLFNTKIYIPTPSPPAPYGISLFEFKIMFES